MRYTMTAKFTLLKSVNKIEEAIADLARTGKSYQKRLHQVAASCLNHVAEHNDTRLLNKLIEAVPNGFRTNALLAWSEEFGNVRWDSTKKRMRYAKDKQPNIEAAIATEPWTFKVAEGNEYRPMDFVKLLNGLIQRAQRHIEEAKVEADKRGMTLETFMDEEGDKIDLEFVDRIKGLVEYDREEAGQEPEGFIEHADAPVAPRRKGKQAEVTVN